MTNEKQWSNLKYFINITLMIFCLPRSCFKLWNPVENPFMIDKDRSFRQKWVAEKIKECEHSFGRFLMSINSAPPHACCPLQNICWPASEYLLPASEYLLPASDTNPLQTICTQSQYPTIKVLSTCHWQSCQWLENLGSVTSCHSEIYWTFYDFSS